MTARAHELDPAGLLAHLRPRAAEMATRIGPIAAATREGGRATPWCRATNMRGASVRRVVSGWTGELTFGGPGTNAIALPSHRPCATAAEATEAVARLVASVMAAALRDGGEPLETFRFRGVSVRFAPGVMGATGATGDLAEAEEQLRAADARFRGIDAVGFEAMGTGDKALLATACAAGLAAGMRSWPTQEDQDAGSVGGAGPATT